MARNSKIEWCDHTVNLWWGCAKEHTGCKNCYAEYLSDTRFKKNLWGVNSNRLLIKSSINDLYKYQELAEKNGGMFKIFCGSMMDIFEDSKELRYNNFRKNTHELRQHLFSLIDAGCFKNLIFLFLTKRPKNIINNIPFAWVNNTPKNVWFGTSVSNQETWKYAETLKLVSNTNLFLSIEPQVGPLNDIDLKGIHWVIQGGESGHNKRPFNLDWAHHIKSLCQSQHIPYFFKQIDGIQPIPESLNIKQFPLEMFAVISNKQ